MQLVNICVFLHFMLQSVSWRVNRHRSKPRSMLEKRESVMEGFREACGTAWHQKKRRQMIKNIDESVRMWHWRDPNRAVHRMTVLGALFWLHVRGRTSCIISPSWGITHILGTAPCKIDRLKCFHVYKIKLHGL